MKDIVWTRIDDRLIHGQVMTQWIQHCGGNEVVIVDDGVAKDTFIQMVMKSSVPKKISLKVLSVKDAITYLTGEPNNEKILILVKIPSVLVSLVEAGVNITFVNVGGMGAKAGRKSLFKNVSASEDEKNDLRRLIDLGVKVFFRVIVTESEEDVAKYL